MPELRCDRELQDLGEGEDSRLPEKAEESAAKLTSEDNPSLKPSTADLDHHIAQLYQENVAGLLRYAMMVLKDRANAQDAVQEAFLRYFVARTEGQEIENDRAWLYCVLRNYTLDRLKSFGEKNRTDLEELLERPDTQQNPEAEYQRVQLIHRLKQVLAPRELECLGLRAEGFGYSEMAEILNVQPGTIGATLARALKKIRNAFVSEAGRTVRMKSSRLTEKK